MARPIQDCVVLLGDSITSRQDVPWSLMGRMCEAYRRTLDILNRGLGGYTTWGQRACMDQYFAFKGEATIDCRLVTIWLGTNDSVLPGAPSQQHVPLEQYIANLNWMLERLTSPSSPYAIVGQKHINIVLITPGPHHQATLPPDMRSTRDLKIVKQYRDAMLQVASNWEKDSGAVRLRCIDLFQAIEEDAGGLGDEIKDFFTDGLHLSTKGYDALWKRLLPLLQTEFKGRGVDPAQIPFTIPEWDVVDKRRPESVVEGMQGRYRR